MLCSQGWAIHLNRRYLVNSFCVPKLFEIAAKSSHFISCINPVVMSHMMKCVCVHWTHCAAYIYELLSLNNIVNEQ